LRKVWISGATANSQLQSQYTLYYRVICNGIQESFVAAAILEIFNGGGRALDAPELTDG
jgi:hypothetical protein